MSHVGVGKYGVGCLTMGVVAVTIGYFVPQGRVHTLHMEAVARGFPSVDHAGPQQNQNIVSEFAIRGQDILITSHGLVRE